MKEEDYNTFLQLRLKKQIELKRNITEVEFFHMIIEEYARIQAQKDQTNTNNANICDGVTG